MKNGLVGEQLPIANLESRKPNRQSLPLRNFPVWAGLMFWAAYLLAFSGVVESMGEWRILSAADGLAGYGLPPDSALAWIFVPALWLGHRLPGVNPLHVALLTNGLLLALVTAGLAWAAAWRGVSPRTVFWIAVVFGALGIAQKFNGDNPPSPVWQAAAGEVLPVRLYLFLPPAILAATLAGSIWQGWRRKSTIPLWLAGLLTLWLTGQFLLGAAHQAAPPPIPADADAARALQTAAPTDAVWLSAPEGDDLRPFGAWWLGNARVPARLTVLSGGEMPPLPASGELWLFERGRRSGDAPHPAARMLESAAFPLDEMWLDGGRLSRYALPNADLPAVPVNVSFEGGVLLETFAVTAQTLSAGDALGVRLRWQVETPPDAPLAVFVHLLAPSGELVVQQDRLLPAPVDGAQGYGLQLPADAPPDEYPLVVGLYRPADGLRLARADGSPDDFVYLTTISVNNE